MPLPRPRRDGGLSVERALAARRSVREFAPRPVSRGQVSQLLWAAQGLTGDMGRRAAPSAGALYPLECRLVAGMVEGLAPGLYRYDPPAHALDPLADGDPRAAIAAACLGQEASAGAPAALLLAAVPSRTEAQYAGRAARYIAMEAGHAAQNVLLQAVSLGLGAVVVGAFDDNALKAAGRLNGDEDPLYLIPVGYPPD